MDCTNNIQLTRSILNSFLEMEGKDLTKKPIKDLRKQLKQICVTYGIDNKDYIKTLSKERRREKKVVYSAQERLRNNVWMGQLEKDIITMKDDVTTLHKEKDQLKLEIEEYRNKINRLMGDQNEFLLLGEALDKSTLELFPHEFLQTL